MALTRSELVNIATSCHSKKYIDSLLQGIEAHDQWHNQVLQNKVLRQKVANLEKINNAQRQALLAFEFALGKLGVKENDHS